MDTFRTSSTGPLIVFAGGGTGGHLYPALALAEAIRTREPTARFRFFGTERTIDKRILDHVECELVPQKMPPLNRAPWRWPHIVTAYRQVAQRCRTLFDLDPPDVVVGTGGISSVPAVREAYRRGIATVLLNPDVVPGRANRYLSRHATTVYVQWEQAGSHFSKQVHIEVLGCPVRSAFNRATRDSGLKRFALDPHRKTLLITGASQGARTVNRAVVANLDFLSRTDWQLLHFTGEDDYGEIRQQYRNREVAAIVQPFTDYMADALSASDLVIGRAGASTLAELTAVGRASILMPYPYHKDQHQLANARCLVRGAAARIVKDRIEPEYNAPALREAMIQLMNDDEQREAMSTAARRMGRGQAACDISQAILGLLTAARPAVGRESVAVI